MLAIIRSLKGSWKTLSIVFLGVLLAFAASVASAQNFRTGAKFWNPPNGGSQCRASFAGIGPFTLSRKLVRQPYPNDDAVNFSAHYGMLLALLVANRNVPKSKAFILDAAQRQAYTKASFNRGWSPIYVQSNIIRLTAMAITVLEKNGKLSADEKRALIVWGDKMIAGQKASKGNKSADSRMASGVALIAWGNVKGDKSLMKAGHRKFMSGYKYVLQSVGSLKRHPAHKSIPLSSLSLEDEYNVALQHAVEGVVVLRNLGIDVTQQTSSGHNFHSAVTWWGSVAASKPASFKGYRSWGHNFHLGWIPIYVGAFPSQPSAKQLKSLARRVSGGKSPAFRAISLGGSTACLW